MGSLADPRAMNTSYQALIRVAALLVAGALLAGCATPQESRDMGDNNDGLFEGDQPEESAGTSGNNTAGDAIVGPQVPATDEPAAASG